MRITFDEVSVKRTFRWIDPATGRARQETKKFFQTVSPFNRTASGEIKSREQIRFEITREADLWMLRKENEAREVAQKVAA